MSVTSSGFCSRTQRAEGVGAHCQEPLARSRRRLGERVEPGRLGLGDGRVPLRPRDAGKAVDRDLGGIGQEPRRPVLANREAEQLGGLVDEPRRAVAGDETRDARAR